MTSYQKFMPTGIPKNGNNPSWFKKGHKHPQEVLEKIKKTQFKKGRIVTEEERNNISQKNKRIYFLVEK